MQLDCAGKVLDLSRPCIMGILNVTPDSFYDGGRYGRVDLALKQAERLVEQGAHILDIGGESTRPGAEPVAVEEELDRVLPVIEQVAANFDIPISIDTSKAEVMGAAVQAGAGMINDVCALQQDGALETAAAAPVPVCLMHMQGDPRSMQQAPQYRDVMNEVKHFLLQRIAECEAAGISRQRLLIDPGFGFGKSVQHNFSLLSRLAELSELELPILIGMSRKSMLGAALGDLHQLPEPVAVDGRLYAGLGAAMYAATHGAHIIRTHDVLATRESLAVLYMLAEGDI